MSCFHTVHWQSQYWYKYHNRSPLSFKICPTYLELYKDCIWNNSESNYGLYLFTNLTFGICKVFQIKCVGSLAHYLKLRVSSQFFSLPIQSSFVDQAYSMFLRRFLFEFILQIANQGHDSVILEDRHQSESLSISDSSTAQRYRWTCMNGTNIISIRIDTKQV